MPAVIAAFAAEIVNQKWFLPRHPIIQPFNNTFKRLLSDNDQSQFPLSRDFSRSMIKARRQQQRQIRIRRRQQICFPPHHLSFLSIRFHSTERNDRHKLCSFHKFHQFCTHIFPTNWCSPLALLSISLTPPFFYAFDLIVIGIDEINAIK